MVSELEAWKGTITFTKEPLSMAKNCHVTLNSQSLCFRGNLSINLH